MRFRKRVENIGVNDETEGVSFSDVWITVLV